MDAVLFDLFGTLVAPYQREEHHDALRRIAGVLGMGFDALLDGWSETWDARATGAFGTIPDNLRAIAPASSDAQLEQAHRIYHDFTLRTLVPKPGALDVLDWLHGRGVPAGLVTNCAPDVPELWLQTRWAHRFATTVFSCQLGVKKPDPAIYRAALDDLGVAAAATVFVGDGSDRELPGAAAVGMAPVLVRNEPAGAAGGATTPEGWPVVDHLEQLPTVLDER